MQCQPAKGQGSRQRPNRLLMTDSAYRSNTSPVVSFMNAAGLELLSSVRTEGRSS
jgi:hypothetical protein